MYFQISSDLTSVNLVSSIIVIGNIIVYEVLIVVLGFKCMGMKKKSNYLKAQRMSIYWGLVMSNMVPLILPWKYNFKGGIKEYSSTLNIQLQYVAVMVLAFLLIASFIH